jgi:hypothetical protein
MRKTIDTVVNEGFFRSEEAAATQKEFLEKNLKGFKYTTTGGGEGFVGKYWRYSLTTAQIRVEDTGGKRSWQELKLA